MLGRGASWGSVLGAYVTKYVYTCQTTSVPGGPSKAHALSILKLGKPLGMWGQVAPGVLAARPASVPPADKRALFIICTSELGPQIYELVAQTSSEKNT